MIDSNEETLIDLPEGITVEYDEVIGYNYIDEKGRVLVSHPKDDNAIRKLVWKFVTNLRKLEKYS